jgi:hypothetical protein
MNAPSHRTTKARILGGLLILPLVISGCCGVSQRSHPEQAGARAHPNLIAHVVHNGVNFSVAVDRRDPAYLRIIVPERFSPPASLPDRTVKVRVLMTDDSREEGIAQKVTPTVGNAGGADVNYLFALGRKISVDDIHSVSISIDGDTYEVCPF